MSPNNPSSGPKIQNSGSPNNNQNGQSIGTTKITPTLPPRPDGLFRPTNNFNVPYPGYGPSTYGNYGGLASYGGLNSYGVPYNGSMYNGGYNNMGMFGPYGGYSNLNDAERRFIQYAEESSRKTFANVESIVRAFSSIAMMLDNTFFAMTSSFRAFLSMADNFGRLRSTFGQIWYSISIFRLFRWMYNKFLIFMGYTDISSTRAAWQQALEETTGASISQKSPSSWSTVAFLGVLVSAPYIISKFLPKYEDNSDMSNWKSPGVAAKASCDFIASLPTEMSIRTNDDIILAPTYIQESMRLKNTGWAFALSNNKSGLIPLNFIILSKAQVVPIAQPHSTQSVLNNQETSNESSSNKNIRKPSITPVLKNNDTNTKSETKSGTKRVSFGENQIFENIDWEDYIWKAEDEAKQYRNSLNDVQNSDEKQKDSSQNRRLEESTS